MDAVTSHLRWPRRRARSVGLLLALLLLAGVVPAAYGQGLTGTLTGIVSDQSKAMIPNASVVLTNEGTAAVRRTVTNADGYFSISAIPTATYSLSIEAQGFAKWERKGIVFHPGDRISLPDISLSVAAVAQEVQVVGVSDVVVPVDTSEKAHVITSRQIQDLSVIGRSADELLKILPGVVYTNPDNAGDPPGLTVRFNAGIGNYNVAGTRNTQVSNISDGTDVIDPGCNCGSAVTPNIDMVQEVKVQTANFAAENAQGPVIFNTVSKSGTANFHGEAYLYARHNVFNSRDWRDNFFDTKKPEDSYYFPGFNIGGPLTKGRQKLFFFTGVEWQRQNHDLGVRPATVPTLAMRKGDFTDTKYINALRGSDVSMQPGNDKELGDSGNGWINSGDPLTEAMLKGGIINPSVIDKGGQALLSLYPEPNQDPFKSKGYNYTSHVINPEHRNQQLTRLDWNISDNTKLYTRFNHEYQASPYPFTLWWYNSNDVPFPGNLKGSYTTWSTSTSLVKVLSPTTTNEVVVGVTDWHMPHTVRDPQKVSRKALGYNYHGLFNDSSDMMPSMTDWGSGVADFVQPGGLLNPTIFGFKWLVNVGDNYSKVVGTHTMKFGGYFAYVTNAEPTTDWDHTIVSPTQWGGNSTGNAFADLLLGRIGDYSESTSNIAGHYHKREWAGYAQDNWKVNRRLTLEIGARFQHPGWMYETDGHMFGFDPKLYDPKAPITAYTGLIAAYKGDKVSNSVWETPALVISPRLGFAWDITGRGNTVFRGGAGAFHYNDRNGDVFGAIGNPPLRTSVNICCGNTLAGIDKIDPKTQIQKAALTTLEPYSDKMPTTYSWSLTLSKRLPAATVMEASYVGNSSSHQMNCTNCGNFNKVPEGAMFGFPKGNNDNDYRPFQSYGTIHVRAHSLSQNYHSLQVTANRQTGRINYSAAYTFAKTMGVGGDSFNVPIDPFDYRGRSYGPLGYDRTHSLSIAYNVNLPGSFRNPVVAGFLNGWQVSGISQLQSGAPLQGLFRFSGGLADGSNYSDRIVTGSPDTQARPVLTCDPRKGLGSNQYANPACFVAPTPGHNGTYIMPYMKTPPFQNHDASLFKNFKITESKKLQFRFSMYNFLNHPNPFFEGSDPGTAMYFCSVGDVKNGQHGCAGRTAGTPDSDTLSQFGKTSFKRGRRLMQFALKFQF